MSAPNRKSGLRVWPLALALLVAPIAFLLARLRTAGMPDFAAACDGGDPFYVAAVYRGQSVADRPPDPSAPSVMLFKDTPEDKVHQQLANFSEVGTVWGLAYSRRASAVFAATYHKRGLPYGPARSGGIYRIDLKTGDTTTFAVVPNAGGRMIDPVMGTGDRDFDEVAARDVGKVALGDLDLNAAETELFVINLKDRKIYRYELATGRLLGSFDHGASGERWAGDARPFALAWYGEHVYHGIVNSMGRGAFFVANVYRSNPDGSAMTLVSSIDLRYARDPIDLSRLGRIWVDWEPWNDEVPPRRSSRALHDSQPMLTDIVFTESGAMVLALRDRHWDLMNGWVSEVYVPPNNVGGDDIEVALANEALGFGDVLVGRSEGDGYRVTTMPERVNDANSLGHEESALGGLAHAVGSENVVAGAYGVKKVDIESILGYEGVYGYDPVSGNRTGLEVVGVPGSFEPYSQLLGRLLHMAHADNEKYRYIRDVASLGDLEALCGFATPPEAPTASITASPTATASNTPSATASQTPLPTMTVTPTAVPTTTPAPAYLPLLLRERCDPEVRRVDVALVVDASLSMLEAAGGGSPGTKLDAARSAASAFLDSLAPGRGDQAAIIAFNAQATVLAPLTDDRAVLDAAVVAIAPAAQTCIVCGVDAAAIELASARHKPDHAAVIVLLTDGRSNPQPASAAVDRAAVAKRAGIAIFTVGLGDDLDEAALVAMASRPQDYRHAPSGAELAAIYRSIAAEIPCARELFWAGR
ncbi:MAG: VWA domain-containing protein [Anaerolineae bacterium]